VKVTDKSTLTIVGGRGPSGYDVHMDRPSWMNVHLSPEKYVLTKTWDLFRDEVVGETACFKWVIGGKVFTAVGKVASVSEDGLSSVIQWDLLEASTYPETADGG
jgi:hypothetical protein